MKKINHCPFCGNNDRRVGIRRMGNKGYKVICGKCGSSGPYVAIKDWHDNKMIAQGQAIDAWNNRKPVEDVLERLKEKIHYVYNQEWNRAMETAIEIIKEELME